MSEGIRGVGGLLLGAAAYLLASQVGMDGWKLGFVTAAVALGCPMVATGRLKGW